MSASNQPAAVPQASLPAHPFGSLADGESFSAPASRDAAAAIAGRDLEGTQEEADDVGSFDFHLGVYARF